MRKRKNFAGKLKIAMLGHKRVPSREGGIEVVVEELSTRMAALGHDVTLYNRRGHHVSGKAFDGEWVPEYKGVHIKRVLTIERKGFAAVTSSFFASVFAAFGSYDVVHYHAEGPCFFCWLPKLFGKRVVATIHGIDWSRAKWRNGFGARYIKMGERVAVKYANEIIVLSEHVQGYFLNVYGRDTRFIPNGVNRPVLREAAEIKNRWGLEKDTYILFLGRIVPEKGLKYLVEAYKNVRTDKKLVIVGGASDTNIYVKEIKSIVGNDERVIFTGFIQGQTLDELYTNAYIYVLPSDLEGMPLSLLEAMSYGNCCVVSDIDECAEVVEDRAITFRRGDVEDLRDKLQACCDDENIVRQYKAEAADFICQKYDWDAVVEKTVRLYSGKDVTGERPVG